MSSAKPPRVLVISSHAFNLYYGAGIALTNYFKGWPKDRLAEIYRDYIIPDKSVCDLYYELGPREICWLWPLSLFFKIHFRERVLTSFSFRENNGGLTLFKKVGQRILRTLGGSQMLVRARLSTELNDWVAKFQPDIIFTQLGDELLMDLIWAISEKHNVPISFQITDNWLDDIYLKGLLAPIFRKKILIKTEAIIKKAKVRWVISDLMGSDLSLIHISEPTRPY